MPSPQPGTQIFKGDMVARYQTIGYTLMINGITTSISIEDPAVIFAVEEANPRITDLTGDARKKVYKSGNNWYLEASIKVRNSSGAYVWWNYKILLCPLDASGKFNYNNLVKGRSLFDNLFSESGVNKQQLADQIAKGVTGWINSIISVRSIVSTGPYAKYNVHARLLPGMLWSTPPATKYENSTRAEQVYTDNSVADITTYWNAYTKENLKYHYFNIQWNIPPIIEVDNTPPTIYFRNSADTADFYSRSWGSTDVTVRLKFSDNGSGYKDSRYAWSTSTSKPSTGWSGWTTSSNYTVTQTGNGSWYLHVEARDKTGNIAYSYKGTYNIDKTAPTITYNPSSSNWTNQNVSVTITASDTGGSGVKEFYYALSSNGGSTWTGWTKITGTSTTVNFTTEGNHKIKAYAIDNAGSTGSTVESGLYLIDKTSASHVSHSISGYRYVDGSGNYWIRPNDVVTVRDRGSDSLSGIISQYLRFYGNGVDRRVFHRWDGAAGEIRTWSPHDDPTHVEVTSVSRTYDSGGQREVTWQAKPKTDGHFYDVMCYYYDLAGNGYGYFSVGKLGVDGTAPTVSISPSNQSWTNQNVTVTITATDSGSGVKRIEYMISTDNGTTWPGTWTQVSGSSTTITLSNTGQYKIRARAVDNVDNTSNYIESGTYQIDKIAPESPTITLSTENWTNQNVTATVSGGSDGHSGVDRIEYRLNGGSWTTYSSALTITTEGITTVEARTVDKSGNTSSIVSKQAKIDKTAPPAPSITVSPSTWTNDVVTVIITTSGSDNISGIDRIEYRINGGSWQVYSSSFAITNEGITTIEARIIDKAGNISSTASKQAKIDKTPPTAPSITVNPSTWTNGTITVTITAGTDSFSGVNRTEYRINGGTWTVYSSSFTVSTEGVHTIEARSIDNVGNISAISSAQAKIDKTAPTVTANPQSRDWGNTDVTVTLTYNDAGAGLSIKQYAWSTKTSEPTWDTTLHSDAITVNNWSAGFNSGVSKPEIGYHAKWVYDGIDGASDPCMKFIDRNDQYGLGHRWLGISQNLGTPASLGWNIGDTITISWYQKSDVLGKGAQVGLYHKLNSTGSYSFESNIARIDVTQTGVWQRVSFTTTIGSNWDLNAAVYLYVYGYQGNYGTLWVDNIQAEKGSTATTFTTTSPNVVKNADGKSISNGTPGSYVPTFWNNYTSAVTQSNDGIWYLHYRAVDSAGNEVKGYFGEYKIDKTLPTLTFTPNSSGWTKSVNVTLTPSDGTGSGIKQWRYAISSDGGTTYGIWSSYQTGNGILTFNTTGAYKIKVEVTDNAGNITTVYSGTYNVDSDAPTINANPTTSNWSNVDVSISLTYNDTGGSGLKYKQYAWSTTTTKPSAWTDYTSGNVVQSGEGIWYLHLQAEDNAGNYTYVYFGPYKIDKTKPTIMANPSSRDWANIDVTVTLEYNDTGGSGLSTRQYVWSTSTITPASGWQNYSSNLIQSNDGTWYLHIRAVDGAGNSITEWFGPYQIDKIAANHVSHSITGYRYKNDNDYWIRANDTVKYKMRGRDILSGIRYSYARLVGSGVDVRSQHDWKAAADHNNQFQTSEQIAIVKAERTYDNGEFREIEWTINSKEYENDFDVQFYYTDNAGNTFGYANTGMKLRIDATKPDVVISRQNGDVLFSESLTMTVTDSRSGLKTVKYSWSASSSPPSSWTDVSDKIVNNTAVIEIKPVTPGPMYLHYYVEDNVGNVASGYTGQYNVIDDSVSLDGLALVRVVNPPHGTRVPVVYPVDVPPAVNAGYKLDFAMMVTGADEADIRLYNKDGERVTMYTTAGAVETLTILVPNNDPNIVKFTFWLDKEMEEGTVLDMEIILRRNLPGGRTSIVGSESLGRNALKIVGSSKDNWRINLTK